MDGDPPPAEWEMVLAIRKYGAQAVMGRALGAGEIRRMEYVELEHARHMVEVKKVLSGK